MKRLYLSILVFFLVVAVQAQEVPEHLVGANCTSIMVGKQAPEICPVCDHPQAYFAIKAENY